MSVHEPESVAGAVGDVDEAPGVADLAVALGVAQRGGEDGFRVLYRDVQPRVLRYLRALVGGDAEDVAAEAWLHIARDIGAFRGGVDDFRGWATRIARNRAMDHLRRQRRRPNADAPAESLHDLPAPSDTADAAVTALATDTAVALIARLPRDQAEAVLLRVVVGLDAKAAATVLGKRAGAVRTAAHRGLRTLATILEQDGVTHFADSALRDMR
ncbi:RNA polymerase sigma factor [Haloechinothrix halophila]|uniref:RNA polymerase sigma factor n=1 Tax=Haloechinothrix halophila TaxID=1069073 RepID=UPI0004006A39|nr:RNA polymerase sigma factor [Haloechinothrix halophila]